MIRLPSSAAVLALAACAPLALVACAAAPPPAASPEPAPPGFYAQGPRPPSPVDQEMLAIGRLEEEIDHLFPEAAAPPGPRKGKAGPAAPTTPPPPPPPRPADGEAAKDAPKQPAGGLGMTGEPCAVACKALSSMASSAERLCQLAGENDGRCEDARARVRGATGRVKSSCPGCTVSTAPAATPKGTPAPERPKGPAPGMPGSSTGLPIP